MFLGVHSAQVLRRPGIQKRPPEKAGACSHVLDSTGEVRYYLRRAWVRRPVSEVGAWLHLWLAIVQPPEEESAMLQRLCMGRFQLQVRPPDHPTPSVEVALQRDRGVRGSTTREGSVQTGLDYTIQLPNKPEKLWNHASIKIYSEPEAWKLTMRHWPTWNWQQDWLMTRSNALPVRLCEGRVFGPSQLRDHPYGALEAFRDWPRGWCHTGTTGAGQLSRKRSSRILDSESSGTLNGSSYTQSGEAWVTTGCEAWWSWSCRTRTE